MTLNKLASAIAKREGKRSQARIGDVREILRLICTIDAEAILEGTAKGDAAIGALIEGSRKQVQWLEKRKARAK